MSKPNREKAKELYLAGVCTAAEIGRRLSVKDATVRGWKSKDDWDGKKTAKTKSVADEAERFNIADVNGNLAKTVDENETLTELEKEFCLMYTMNPNATSAYRKSHPNVTYGTCRTQGCRLLTKPNIRTEIKKLKQIKRESLLVDEVDILDKMMRIAFSDITDYLEWGRVDVPVMGEYGAVIINSAGDDDGTPLMRTVNEMRFVESDAVDGTLVAEVKQGKDGVSVKLADQMKAMLWLADYFEMNPRDKHKREYDKFKLRMEERKLNLTKQKLIGVYSIDDATGDIDDENAGGDEIELEI